MSEKVEVIAEIKEEISPASIQGMLESIRPVWRGKGLIQRVERILPVDPSSACQRLLNAAIRDLREKIVTIGVNIAKEIATNYSLPPVVNNDDILEHYSTYNIIELSYRIGILTRPEWRRMQRCYEIRRDLEHEDNEYEAVLEDTFYIFKSTIEVVLNKDPIELLRVTEVRQIVEEASRITISENLIKDYERAPKLRQEEILKFLVSTAKNSDQPDVVRDNSFELLRHFKSKTLTPVVITIAAGLEESLGRSPIDLVTAKIGHAIGATSYFKRAKLKDYYTSVYSDFKIAGGDWDVQASCTKIFHDIGHFTYCPDDMIDDFLIYLVLWYIGVPGGYGHYGRNRAVFNSNDAAPIIKRIIKYSPIPLVDKLEELRENGSIKGRLVNKSVAMRFENLLDLADRP